jgi:hypothetical protein
VPEMILVMRFADDLEGVAAMQYLHCSGRHSRHTTCASRKEAIEKGHLPSLSAIRCDPATTWGSVGRAKCSLALAELLGAV